MSKQIRLAFDPADRPHVAYGGDRVYHAVRDGGGWTIEENVAGPGAGETFDLALAGSGRPRIVHSGYRWTDVHLASFEGSVWTSQLLAAPAPLTRYYHSALVLDRSDRPIVFVGSSESNSLSRLESLTWTGTAWQTDPISDEVELVFGASRLPSGAAALAFVRRTFSPVASELKYSQWTGSAWSLESPVPGREIRAGSAPRGGSAGDVLIAYWDQLTRTVWLARRSGTSWTTAVVDASSTAAYSVDLAVDGSGRAIVAYPDLASGTLKVAFQSGSTWDIQTASSPGSVGESTSVALAVDSAGIPAVVFSDPEGQNLVYARPAGSSWSQEVFDVFRLVAYAHLGFDATGNPVLLHHRSRGRFWSLVTARWNGAGWELQDLPGSTGQLVGDVASTPGGVVHAAIVDRTDSLKLGRLQGGIWSLEDLPAISSEFSFLPRIELDSNGNPVILDRDAATEQLRVSSWNGSTWSFSPVPSPGLDRGTSHVDLALDASDRPVIAWIEVTASSTHVLHLSRWNGTRWMDEVVRSWSGSPLVTSVRIALDQAGNPVIAHAEYAWPSVRLWVSWTSGTAWSHGLLAEHALPIAAGGSPGFSLATDPAGSVRMAWSDPFGRMHLAERSGPGWSVRELAEAGTSAWTPDLRIDPLGRTHIAYLDGYDLAVKLLSPVPLLPGLILRGPGIATLAPIATAPLGWTDPDPVLDGSFPPLLFYQVGGVERIGLQKSALSVRLSRL